MNKGYKNLLLALFCFLSLILGFWFYNQKKNSRSGDDLPSIQKFFSPSEILEGDIVVRQNEAGFSPAEIVIKKGTRVVWVNESSTYVWPASNLHPTHGIYPEFDPLEPIAPGKAWAFKYEKVGEWKYHDHLKPNRRGIIKVE